MKKTIYLQVLAALLMSLAATKALAYDIAVANADGVTIYYNYISDGAELEVTLSGSSSTRYRSTVVIPEKIEYNGTVYGVTSIGNGAFSGCTGLTSVIIPNSVTSIGYEAFYGCSGLTSVTIPNSVTSIGSSAFYWCRGLTSIIIPNSVTSIGEKAFCQCSDLTSVTIGNSVTSIGYDAFYSSGLTSVHITDLAAWCSITFSSTSSNPLYYAHHLYLNGEEIKDMVIPSSVTSIGYAAFAGCSGLTSVNIPNSVTSIGHDAFYGCNGLTSVTIPNSVTTIGNDAFSGTAWYDNQSDGIVYAGKVLYKYKGTMPNDTAIVIDEGALSISPYAFYGCSGLTSVTIPNSVTSIGSYSFYQCTGLTSVTIGNRVTSIGVYAFNGCYRIHTIYSLNPIPPSCGNSIFIIDTSNFPVRDSYEVYTYANLHVPMGSKEIYSGAYDWRYFNKIKEDMESGGNVHYTQLTVQQGTTGYTRQAVKAAEKYTFFIGSFDGNKVNAVTFNGIDVTDEVENGYYTTPEIQEESVISISYEMTACAVSNIPSNVKVIGRNGEIVVSNIDKPSDVSIFTADGMLVNTITAAHGTACLQVRPEQLYLVKVGSRTYKVAL